MTLPISAIRDVEAICELLVSMQHALRMIDKLLDQVISLLRSQTDDDDLLA